MVTGKADAEGQRAEERAAHRRGGHGRHAGRIPTRASRRRIRCRGCGPASSGRASAASTTRTATATSSAPARRWRRTRSSGGRPEPMGDFRRMRPLRVLNAGQMREADRRTIDDIGIPSIVLMENAGRQVVAAIETLFRRPAGARGGHRVRQGQQRRRRLRRGPHAAAARASTCRCSWSADVTECGATRASTSTSSAASACRSSKWPTSAPGSCTAPSIEQHDLIIDAMFGTGPAAAAHRVLRDRGGRPQRVGHPRSSPSTCHRACRPTRAT